MAARGRDSFNKVQVRRLEAVGHMSYVRAPLPLSPSRFLREFYDAEIAGLTPRGATGLDSRLVCDLPRLKAVSIPTTGWDWLNVSEFHRRGVSVSYVPDFSSDSTAEFTWGLILALNRRIPWARLGSGTSPLRGLMGTELRGKTLGVVGLGAIGSRVASLGHAFGMRVLGTDPKSKPRDVLRVGFRKLLSSSDIVTLHLPLDSSTQHFIRAKTLSLMKPSSILINTSRPGLVDSAAVLDYLRQRKLRAYAFDVGYDPLSRYRNLCHRPDVLCVPHISWYTKEAVCREMDRWVDELVTLALGKPGHLIRPNSLERR